MGRTSHVKVILIAIVIQSFVIEVCIGGKILTESEIRRQLKSINKPAVKTIKSECGSIIDCVDIYKQPAFDHPLLKNHTIQMKPSHFNSSKVSSKPIEQTWHKSGSCPRGTVPIVRVKKSDLLRAERHKMDAVNGGYENARLEAVSEHLRGGYAMLNVWNVHVEPNEYSISGVFVGYIFGPDLVTAGWMVSPLLYGDNVTRVYAAWVDEDNVGCYNLDCPGFIQTEFSIALGVPIEPISIYNGPQYQINIKIIKNLKEDHWWLEINEKPVGYWPASLFKNIRDDASRVQWGGQVSNTSPGGRHTTTQMGSGHFPSEGKNKSAFIANALIYDDFAQEATPIAASFSAQITNKGCYNVHILGQHPGGIGADFLYGGPGGPNC